MKIAHLAKRCILATLLLTVLCAGPAVAQPKKQKDAPKTEAQLIVNDSGGMFTADGIKKAKAALSEIKDHMPREMMVVTYRELTAAQKKEFEKLDKPEAKREFWSEWGKTELAGLKAHGVVVLICGSPGHLAVYVDRAVRDQGFTVRDEQLIERMLLERFKEAAEKPEAERPAIHDKGLINAAEFVSDAYKKMVR
jgi:hypothetical protein